MVSFNYSRSACKIFSDGCVRTTPIDIICLRWSFLLMFYNRKTDRISCCNLIILKRNKKPYLISVSHCSIYCVTLVPSSADLKKGFVLSFSLSFISVWLFEQTNIKKKILLCAMFMCQVSKFILLWHFKTPTPVLRKYGLIVNNTKPSL